MHKSAYKSQPESVMKLLLACTRRVTGNPHRILIESDTTVDKTVSVTFLGKN